MAIVLINGNHYITYMDSGATKKTTDINSAFQFPTVAEAIRLVENCYIYEKFLIYREVIGWKLIIYRMNGKIKGFQYQTNRRR